MCLHGQKYPPLFKGPSKIRFRGPEAGFRDGDGLGPAGRYPQGRRHQVQVRSRPTGRICNLPRRGCGLGLVPAGRCVPGRLLVGSAICCVGVVRLGLVSAELRFPAAYWSDLHCCVGVGPAASRGVRACPCRGWGPLRRGRRTAGRGLVGSQLNPGRPLRHPPEKNCQSRTSDPAWVAARRGGRHRRTLGTGFGLGAPGPSSPPRGRR